MLKRLIFVLLAFPLSATSAFAQASPQASAGPAAPPFSVVRSRDFAAQLTLLMEWWPGIYDNHEQVVRQSGGGLSSIVSKPFRRLHSEVQKISAPALGDNVLSIVTYVDNDPTNVTRNEIVAVAIDAQARALRVTRYKNKNRETVDGASIAEALRTGGVSRIGAECDILLRYVGNQFEGGLASRKCPALAGNSEYEVVIAARSVWERDQGRNPKTNAVAWEMAPGSDFDWYQESRARMFGCTVFENAEGIMPKTRYLKTIHLHDQGGESEMVWPDGRTLVFTIHNRAFTSPTTSESPLFRIHEKGNPIPIAYAYAGDGSKRFGINLGWFYIRCYDEADPDTAAALRITN